GEEGTKGVNPAVANVRMRSPRASRSMLLESSHRHQERYIRKGAHLYCGDFKKLSEHWPSPVVIVSDGPYGVASYPGDPPTPAGLADWYRPYAALWAERSTPETTLWFWNTEVGWANVHPVLEANGWEYRCCHVWDKGIGHIAGHANTQTL